MADLLYNPLLRDNLQEMQDIPEPPAPMEVDDELSLTSTKPVQNKVITGKINDIEHQIQVFQDIDVKSWSEFLAAVNVSQTISTRIHFRANITVESQQTLNLSNCLIFGHYYKFVVNSITTILVGNYADFSDVLFQGANAGGAATSLFRIEGLASTSCRFYFNQCRFYNFLEQGDTHVFVIYGASGSSIHTEMHMCVINGESAMTTNNTFLVAHLANNPCISLKVVALMFAGKDTETRKVGLTGTLQPADIFCADGSCEYTTTKPANFFQWGTPTDPSQFASAAQGAKADSALQSISKGTNGDYITTTVGAKDANSNQTVCVSLTIQDISTADNDHRGLLEALNTRNYIDTQIYNVSLNFFFYGVQWDENDPSPDCTRIGNMSLHAELPVQNAIIGGLLQDDLTFTPFPDQSDWSGETVDGSLGQVMVQIPKHYFKSEINGTIHKKLISQYPLAGFIEIPLMYVSAEKATVDRTDPNIPKLCSVVNTSTEYRGGQNNSDWDNTYRSLLGKPTSNISLANFRQYARNRGNGTAWNCHTYLAQRVLYWLFVTEYATLNSQKAFNAAKDANGYAQGGLGPGTSDWNDNAWLAYNNDNPLIPCGYMLEYGNQSAVKNYNVLDADGNTLHTFSVNSYRGIQSPFGDIWDWTDGILINVQSDAAGGISTCYITDDPAKFSSFDFSQYTELGNTPRAGNCIKTIFDDEQGNIVCKTQGGSSTSYYCDYYWGANLPAPGVSLRGVLFGGAAVSGSRCGFLCAHSHSGPGDVYPFIGSRLCAIPPP